MSNSFTMNIIGQRGFLPVGCSVCVAMLDPHFADGGQVFRCTKNHELTQRRARVSSCKESRDSSRDNNRCDHLMNNKKKRRRVSQQINTNRVGNMAHIIKARTSNTTNKKPVTDGVPKKTTMAACRCFLVAEDTEYHHDLFIYFIIYFFID